MPLAPKPSHRLALSSDGADGTPPASVTGLRWAFALQTPLTDAHLIVETARREHNQLKFKLPQVERSASEPQPDEALGKLLDSPLFRIMGVTGYRVLGVSAPIPSVLPQGFKDENVLEITYVHALLETTSPFSGNDFMKLMIAQMLLEYCQSYRYQAYRRILKQFGLL